MTISKEEYEKFKSEFFKGECHSKKRKYSSSTASIFGGFLLLGFLLLNISTQAVEILQLSVPSVVGLLPSTIIFFLIAKLNITDQKEKRFYDLGKFNILFLIVYVLLTLIHPKADCTSKAQTAHGWDKSIYHHCMGTPKGFRW